MSEIEHLHPAQEPDALSSKWLTSLGVGTIALTIALALIAARVVHRHGDDFGGEIYPRPIEDPLSDLPADYVLEFHLFERFGPGEGERAQQDERELLESWGWVDREAGTVHLPIDVAIERALAPSAQETP